MREEDKQRFHTRWKSWKWDCGERSQVKESNQWDGNWLGDTLEESLSAVLGGPCGSGVGTRVSQIGGKCHAYGRALQGRTQQFTSAFGLPERSRWAVEGIFCGCWRTPLPSSPGMFLELVVLGINQGHTHGKPLGVSDQGFSST